MSNLADEAIIKIYHHIYGIGEIFSDLGKQITENQQDCLIKTLQEKINILEKRIKDLEE